MLRANEIFTPTTSISYRLCTKSVQSRGPENIGPERMFPDLMAKQEVDSSARITLENNERIRPLDNGEKSCSRANGGGGGTGSERSQRFARQKFIKTSRILDKAFGLAKLFNSSRSN